MHLLLCSLGVLLPASLLPHLLALTSSLSCPLAGCRPFTNWLRGTYPSAHATILAYASPQRLLSLRARVFHASAVCSNLDNRPTFVTYSFLNASRVWSISEHPLVNNHTTFCIATLLADHLAWRMSMLVECRLCFSAGHHYAL